MTQHTRRCACRRRALGLSPNTHLLPLLPHRFFCDPNYPKPEGEKSEHSSHCVCVCGGGDRSVEAEREEGQAPWGTSRKVFSRWGSSFYDIWHTLSVSMCVCMCTCV